MRTFDGTAELAAAVGEELGYSRWHRVGPAEITAFAEATGDRQWIHVDPVRAADGPFGTLVAHGYYLLAAVPMLLAEVFEVVGVAAVVNTGVDALRFRRPVPAGSRIRAGARIAAVALRRGVADLSLDVEVHRESVTGAVCTATVHSMVRPLRSSSGPGTGDR